MARQVAPQVHSGLTGPTTGTRRNSRAFQQRLGAIEIIRRRIAPAVEIGFRWREAVSEEIQGGINDLGDVDVSIVVTITGIQAGSAIVQLSYTGSVLFCFRRKPEQISNCRQRHDQLSTTGIYLNLHLSFAK